MVVPSDILRRPVLHAGLLAFLANYAQFSVWLLVPFYLVSERGLSAAAGGLLFMLTPLATGIVAPIAGRMVDLLGARGPMVAGLAVEAAGLLLVARCDGSTPLPLVGGALALVGLGLGIFQVPNIAQAMAAFPPRQQGAAGGFAFLSRTSGVVVGVQAAAWLFHERALTLGFLPAFRFTFAAAAAVCSLAALVALLPGLARVPRATR
jgi:MFS family permease